MKLLILYRPESEHARAVETFIHDFRHQHEDIAHRLEILHVDSREGAAIMSLYDIMQHPALLVLADDGSLIQYWNGETLPLMGEVASYFH